VCGPGRDSFQPLHSFPPPLFLGLTPPTMDQCKRAACRAVAVVALCLLWWPAARGLPRFRRGTVLYEQEMQVGRDVLAEYLKSHPDLVDTFFPSRFLLQSEFYR
jgi:hypothetical protein